MPATLRLPRWLVILLLASSAMVACTTGVWWWITWPDRTAREFLALMADGKFENANGMLRIPDRSIAQMNNATREHTRTLWSQTELGIGYPRTLADFLFGRRVFKLELSPDDPQFATGLSLFVERGTVGYEASARVRRK